MSQTPNLDLRIYAGPGLIAPFAAVVAEFSSPFASPRSTEQVGGALSALLPGELKQHIALPPGEVGFEELAKRLVSALHNVAGPCDLPLELQYADNGSARLVLGYHDPQAAMRACRSAVLIALAVFSEDTDASGHRKEIAAIVQQAALEMKLRQPDPLARAIMRRAKARGMPVYPVSPGSRVWLYGQGCAGWHFFEAGNHRDSHTGGRLARDKVLSNQLVRRLGLPGVEHAVVATPEAAARIAGHLGFPVVVKPVDLGKGQGVSANITNVEELQAAFAKALPLSRRGVIVERQVPGDDHRLVVVGGKLQWAIRRSPPRITGNGVNTIAELVDLENGQRSEDDIRAGFLYRIVIDDDVRKTLAKNGLSVDDRPESGQVIDLRSIANTATGGTLVDCTASVHPDNREMAEAIAGGFHLDAVGIDFITADITKSWRELICGVIEVNTTPGLSSDDRAEIILADKFPDGAAGRLPSIVVIGEDRWLIERAGSALEEHVGQLGRTDSAETLLAGRLRCRDGDTLPDRVMALLLDASCEALVIGAAPQEIERYGFPLDRCDLAVISGSTPVSQPLRELVEACARKVIPDVSSDNFDDNVLPVIVSAVDGVTRR